MLRNAPVGVDRSRLDSAPQILLVNPASTPSEHKTFEPNIYPNLGLLTLATSLQCALDRNNVAARVLYYDGALLGDEFIRDYIAQNARYLAVIGYSSYTLNYGACVSLARHAKTCNAGIVNVIGNDHFSALYREIMTRQKDVFDYGFCGNDVVEGFTEFVLGLLTGKLGGLHAYAGLVYRDPLAAGGVASRPENPAEFSRLPLPDYSLLDSLVPHSERYHQEQLSFYAYVREERLRITVIEIARGCLKFKGQRNESGIPLNACDFCGIIPGGKALSAQNVQRAWDTIRNAFEHGYNYLFVTADELPSTFWPLVKAMADELPDWYRALEPRDRPRMMCYARADAFRERVQDRIDLLMNTLGFDHFFVGLDGFSSASLRAMNKGINRIANDTDDLLHHNLVACEEISRRGGKLSAGAVITHMGITPAMLETNYRVMRQVILKYPRLFMEIDFELLCPIPGSLAFDYLRRPGMARARADALGLDVDDIQLARLNEKYRGKDDLDPQELTRDFIVGCCPDITVEMAHDYLRRIRELVDEVGIAYDCSNIGEQVSHDAAGRDFRLTGVAKVGNTLA
jgi:anaerobic magnesium-protoporphyrin IX monomethyl ester cyclase